MNKKVLTSLALASLQVLQRWQFKQEVVSGVQKYLLFSYLNNFTDR